MECSNSTQVIVEVNIWIEDYNYPKTTVSLMQVSAPTVPNPINFKVFVSNDIYLIGDLSQTNLDLFVIYKHF